MFWSLEGDYRTVLRALEAVCSTVLLSQRDLYSYSSQYDGLLVNLQSDMLTVQAYYDVTTELCVHRRRAPHGTTLSTERRAVFLLLHWTIGHKILI